MVLGVLLQALCDLGYSAMDIITTLFRVVRNYNMQEFLKLEFIKVSTTPPCKHQHSVVLSNSFAPCDTERLHWEEALWLSPGAKFL